MKCYYIYRFKDKWDRWQTFTGPFPSLAKARLWFQTWGEYWRKKGVTLRLFDYHDYTKEGGVKW